MPLHPPAGSALTSPVYFGLRLDASRVCTPALLRAHLQTVRQTLQCDFIVIPTASDSSLEASKASAAQKSKEGVKKSAEAVRESHTARSVPFRGTNCHVAESCTAVTDTGLPLPDEGASLTDRERISRLAVGSSLSIPNRSSAAKHEDDCTRCAATAATTESTVLVESPTFATGRATIPVQHLADAAVDFSTFCRNFLPPPTKGGSGVLGDDKNQNEVTVEPPVRRPGKPSFCAVDGGLAALPATYAFAPSTESDLALDSQTWNAAVVCELSPWISPDLGVLPERRKVATPSRGYCTRRPPSGRTPVSKEAYASSPAGGRCPLTSASIPSPHYGERSRSAVAAAAHSTHSHATSAGAAAGEKVSNRGPRRVSTASAAEPAQALTQSKGGNTEGQKEQQTHYNKRSRTAARGEFARKGALDESNEVAYGMEQQPTDTHDEQLQYSEPPSVTDPSADGINEAVDPREKSTDCSAAASAAPPAAAAELLVMRASAPSSDSVHAAAATPEASTASASALRSAARSSASRRRGQLAGRRKEQRQLEHGLLRHWSFHERAWHREMQWATHVGAFAVITPPPAPDLIPVEYSRLLRAALDQLQPPIIWMKLPLVYSVTSSSSNDSKNFTRESCLSSSSNLSSTASESSTTSESSSSGEDAKWEDGPGKDNRGGHTAGTRSKGISWRSKAGRRRTHEETRRRKDPWELWQYIRSMVGPHPSLGLCLEMTPDLPDSDSELERWFAEPLRAVVLSPSLFTSSSTSCSSSSSFPGVGKDKTLGAAYSDSQRPRDSGRPGSRLPSAGKAAARRNAAAAESGVCLSPRHHLFLMKCAQHRVKIIFQFEDDEKDEVDFEVQQPVPAPGPTAAGGAPRTPARAAAPDKSVAAAEEGKDKPEKSKTLTRNSEMVACKDTRQQSQVEILAADDFPPLAVAGHAASKERANQSATAARKESRTKTASPGGGAAAQKGRELEKSSEPPLVEMQPYISYVAQQLLQLPALKQTELFSAPYRDVLQSPMQPLADNLSAGNYEVFEKDPVKYLRYKEATLLRLREIWPATSAGQHHSKVSEAQGLVKRDARQHQGQTKQPQEQQQGGQRQGRNEAAAAVASETSLGRVSPDVETQKKRKKNRGRRRGRHAGTRSAYYWECGSDDDDDEEEGYETAATAFPDVPSSPSAAGSCAYASASFPVPSSGGCLPPPPPPPASPCFSASSNRWSMAASDWCLRGANCSLHAAVGPRLVLTIVGAGRGPLVQAALEALREAGIPLCRARVFAVEKNWNAVITLRSRVRSDACVGWRAVEVVEADMREAGDCVAERADILISELLGSFGDNELSAECLDGAQMRLLKKGGVSIPSAYVSSLEPVSTHTLWQAIDSYNDPKQFECAYVVNMFAKYFPAKEGPKECFHYRHPHFLLPFGDGGDSSSSSSEGGGGRGGQGGVCDSTGSSGRWAGESISSDSGSDSERKKDSARRRRRSGSREERRRSSRSGRGSGRREDEAAQEEGRREGEQGTAVQGETCKRHEVNALAATAEPIHVKGAARNGAQGRETVAAAGSSEQEEDARVRVAAAADTATKLRAKNKVTGVAGETGGSATSGIPSGSGKHFFVREKKKEKKPPQKERCGFTAAELTVLRHRRTRLSWRMRTDTVVHGLAGYFHCCLYKSVYISIDPRSFSEGMFSWFPLFLPFRQPVYVHRNEKLEVYIARDGDEHKVWYEWAVLQPTPSEIYNHMGKHSYIGK